MKLAVVRLVTAPLSVILPEVVTVPDRLKPLTEPVPDTEVTVPEPGDIVQVRLPPENDNPVPTVTLLNPPEPFPYRIDEPVVAAVALLAILATDVPLL